MRSVDLCTPTACDLWLLQPPIHCLLKQSHLSSTTRQIRIYMEIVLIWTTFSAKKGKTSSSCEPQLLFVVCQLHTNKLRGVMSLDGIYKKHPHVDTAAKLLKKKLVTKATTGSCSPPSQPPLSSILFFRWTGAFCFEIIPSALETLVCKCSFMRVRLHGGI